MRKWLTFFLLFLIAIQLLPFKQMGALLYGDQLIEEICQSNDLDCNHAESKDDLKKNDPFIHNLLLNMAVLSISDKQDNPFERNYASRLADDKPTRPPLSILI